MRSGSSLVVRVASALEEQFAAQLDAYGVVYEREQMLIPGRKFRFDFVVPHAALVCEVEGGTWSGGRHTRGSGFRKDCEKYNLAVEHGYAVLRYTSDMIKNGLAAEQVRRYLTNTCAEKSPEAL